MPAVASQNKFLACGACVHRATNVSFCRSCEMNCYQLPSNFNPSMKVEDNNAVSSQYNAADVLDLMANTFRERNAVYGDNYKMVGKLMAVLFPNGAAPEIMHGDSFHLFELMLVKISRLAISNLQHRDSALDAGVYSAMIVSIIDNESKNGTPV